MPRSETQLSKAIADALALVGVYSDRLNAGRWKVQQSWVHGCRKGTPDRFALVNGHMVFLEVKRPGKKADPHQLERHAELRSHGATVLVVDDVADAVAAVLNVRAST